MDIDLNKLNEHEEILEVIKDYKNGRKVQHSIIGLIIISTLIFNNIHIVIISSVFYLTIYFSIEFKIKELYNKIEKYLFKYG